jgi:nucleotide-binding universal stress UspA family protein
MMTSAAGHGILVGYDGSPGSKQAVRWAAREARSRGAALTVCQAWDLGYPAPPSPAAAFDLARHAGEQILADGMRYARSVAGGREVRPLLLCGSAAHVLCEQGANADMVVLGSRGHGGLAGMLLGSVSAQVTAHAAGRVVVVRGHWQPAGGYVPGAVVVGADGSEACSAAISFAFEEAALRDAALLAVCALADTPGSLGGARQIEEQFELAVAREEKAYPEVTALRQIARGAPRAALLAAAQDAQMLVVGARGRGGLRGMRLGSVSHAVLHHATCPVGVVHL